jgi:hypothetical protein
VPQARPVAQTTNPGQCEAIPDLSVLGRLSKSPAVSVGPGDHTHCDQISARAVVRFGSRADVAPTPLDLVR